MVRKGENACEEKKAFENMVRKGENACVKPALSPFLFLPF